MKYIVKFCLFVCLLSFLTLGGWLGYVFYTLPNIKHLEDYRPPLTSVVYADDGSVIGEFFIQRRYFVSLDKIPSYVVKAFVAAEDERFYEHKGLDWIGIFRALIKDLKARAIVQGGSTITQQTVKALLLTPKRTFTRKLKEIILAYQLERYLTKDEILTIYLNQIYFGHGAYGVEAAARVYFGKHVNELNLAEAAILAGLPKGPAFYSPYRHPKRAKERQRYVLMRMVKCGFISKKEAKMALATPLHLASLDYHYPSMDYFLEYVKQKLIKKFGVDKVFKGGLSIYTTASIPMHQAAQDALEKGILAIEKRHKENQSAEAKDQIQGAIFTLERGTNYIKVMLGGRSFQKSKFNRVTQACRQPGSAFKPIIYAAALDKGYTPASLIEDYPIIYVYHHQNKIKVWRPHNYEERFFGRITLRDALVHSRNTVTVRLLKNIGIHYVIDYAHRFGITRPLSPDLSLALGSSCLSLYELTRAFSVFANEGQYIEPIAITKVVDSQGHVLLEKQPAPQPAIGPDTAYLITSILEDVVQRGTARVIKRLHRPAAGKTGTTNQYTDAWFIGYTPYYVAGVWVGYDDLKSLGRHETGGRAAAPIWLYFIKQVESELPIRDFNIPSSVVFAQIDPQTGLLVGPENSHRKIECFKRDKLPPKETNLDLHPLEEKIYLNPDF